MYTTHIIFHFQCCGCTYAQNIYSIATVTLLSTNTAFNLRLLCSKITYVFRIVPSIQKFAFQRVVKQYGQKQRFLHLQ